MNKLLAAAFFLVLLSSSVLAVVPEDNPAVSGQAAAKNWTLVNYQNSSVNLQGTSWDLVANCLNTSWGLGAATCAVVTASSRSYGSEGKVIDISGNNVAGYTNYINKSVASESWIIKIDVELATQQQYWIIDNNKTVSEYDTKPSSQFQWNIGSSSAFDQFYVYNSTARVHLLGTSNFTGMSNGWVTWTIEHIEDNDVVTRHVEYWNNLIIYDATPNELLMLSNITPTTIGGAAWNGVGHHYFGNLTLYTEFVEPAVTAGARPNITNINFTSGTPAGGDTTPVYTTNDTTPTVTFNTDIDADCRIMNANSNYSDMGASRDCSGDGTTEHTCTVISSDIMYPVSRGVYPVGLGCVNADFEGNQTVNSTSGELPVFIQGLELLSFLFPTNGQTTSNNSILTGNATTGYNTQWRLWINQELNQTVQSFRNYTVVEWVDTNGQFNITATNFWNDPDALNSSYGENNTITIFLNTCVSAWSCTEWINNGTLDYRSCMDSSSCSAPFIPPKPDTERPAQDVLLWWAGVTVVSLILIALAVQLDEPLLAAGGGILSLIAGGMLLFMDLGFFSGAVANGIFIIQAMLGIYVLFEVGTNG